jgi:hypothetical protein
MWVWVGLKQRPGRGKGKLNVRELECALFTQEEDMDFDKEVTCIQLERTKQN